MIALATIRPHGAPPKGPTEGRGDGATKTGLLRQMTDPGRLGARPAYGDLRRPQRQGFGSRLLLRGLTGDLSSPAELIYAPEGLICRLDVPALGKSED